MGVEDSTKADGRAETTDKPTTQDRPYAPPPDNPGSPGQPSRLESLARAREAQQAGAAQRIAAANAGGKRDTTPGTEIGDKDAQAYDEQSTDEPSTQDRPTAQATEVPTTPDALDTQEPGDETGLSDRDATDCEPSGEDAGRPADQQETAPDATSDEPQSGDWERRISGEGLPPDEDARVTDLDEEAYERGVADRLKQIARKLDRSDQPEELADTVDRPDFQDPSEDPAYVPNRYGTPLERRDGTRTPLFDGEPTREQAEQGVLGDCGIIATLGAVAEHHPEALRDCVQESDDGSYQVRLHEAKFSRSNWRYEPTGRPITLTVTPDLPVFDQRPGTPAFANSTSTGAAWAPVLEKAIAGTDQTWNDERRDKQTAIWNARGKTGNAPTGYIRLNQGSNAGERSELLTQLTGRPAKTVEFPSGYDNRGRSADHQLRDEITDQLSDGKPVLVGSRSLRKGETTLPRNLRKSHVYEVTKIDDKGMLHLHNPWNTQHPEPMTIQEFKANIRPRYSTLE